jgi:NADPH:quinone reductase-like Zn-dependent oxidoreductase
MMHKPNRMDLNNLTELFEAGKVVPIVDKHYELGEITEAFRHYGEGMARGKIVVTV